MMRFLVQDWYLDEFGDSVLQSERLFRTEKEAFLFARNLSRRLNGFHSVDVVELRSVFFSVNVRHSKE